MKLFMRIFSTCILLIIGFTVLGYLAWHKPACIKEKQLRTNISLVDDPLINDSKSLRLKNKAKRLYQYARARDYNMTYCFLLDMKINSGKKRFFVYNVKADSVEACGLVTHGSGSDKGTPELFFSNTAGSNCTSLGIYRVGKDYMGKFGHAFKLYGLDKTNSNAFNRFVVLHAHACVPNEDVYPLPICESWGCPTVAPAFLQTLTKYLEKAENPILLEIYY